MFLTFKNKKSKDRQQKSTGERPFGGSKSPGMYEGIMRHERRLQINLSTSQAEGENLPGRKSLSMNSTALWTEVKLPPAEES